MKKNGLDNVASQGLKDISNAMDVIKKSAKNVDEKVNQDIDVLAKDSESIGSFIEEQKQEINDMVSEGVLASKEQKDTNFIKKTEEMIKKAREEGDETTAKSLEDAMYEIVNSYSLQVLHQRFTPDLVKELKKNPKKLHKLQKTVMTKLGNAKSYTFPNPQMLLVAVRMILPEDYKKHSGLFTAHLYSFIVLSPLKETALFTQKVISNIFFVKKSERTEYNNKFIKNMTDVIDFLLNSETGV